MSRRWTFSPQDRPTLPPQQSGEKLTTLLEHPPSPPPHQLQPWRGHAPGPCTIISAAPLSSAARGSPMWIRRCGSASEAWRAKASRTSSERRPMEGPQRTSGGDALGSPERPRPSVAGRNRLRGGRCLVAGLFRHKTGQRCHLNKAAKNSQRSSSTRRPLRLINCSPGEGVGLPRATLTACSARPHRPDSIAALSRPS
jgi:hypothetical protein